MMMAMRAGDRVLLIDVENTVGSVRPRPDVVRRRVGALVSAAGPVHHVVASYAPDDPAVDVAVSVLAELGVAPWPVPPGANAADHALLRHARYVYDRGGRVFAVASADGRFARLAELGRLEVLVWHNQKVARALENAAAGNVQRVSLPTGGGGPPLAARRDTAAATVTVGESDALISVDGQRDAVAPAEVAPVAVDPGWRGRLIAGGSVWRAAGCAVMTGVGIGVGQRLAGTVLRR
jgi:hypothetical protein